MVHSARELQVLVPEQRVSVKMLALPLALVLASRVLALQAQVWALVQQQERRLPKAPFRSYC